MTFKPGSYIGEGDYKIVRTILGDWFSEESVIRFTDTTVEALVKAGVKVNEPRKAEVLKRNVSEVNGCLVAHVLGGWIPGEQVQIVRQKDIDEGLVEVVVK